MMLFDHVEPLLPSTCTTRYNASTNVVHAHVVVWTLVVFTSAVRKLVLSSCLIIDKKTRSHDLLAVLAVFAALLRSASLTEAVLCLTRQLLQVAATSSSGGLAADGLLRPVVLSDLLSRVSAVSAALLLKVESTSATTDAQAMCMAIVLTHRTRTLRHLVGG